MQRLIWLTDILWNPWLLGCFLLTGLYCSVRSGFFQLFGLRTWLGATVGSLLRPAEKRQSGEISQLQALCTALASTIGTGSIAGVATAIWFGGPGAVFWMWLSAVLGMMTGFVEKTLAVCTRIKGTGRAWMCGPMYYLRDGVGSRFLAGWYAAACLCASLISGNLVQSNAIADILYTAFGWERIIVGAGVSFAVAAVMVGGLKRVAQVSSWLVPVMTFLYLGSGLAVLIFRAGLLPKTIHMIVVCAASPEAFFGGGIGYSISSAMRYGVARGVFTNEAGLGTSSIAHAAAEADHPAQQGMWGILEVGVSTLLVCTVTALTILTSGVYDPVLGAAGVPPVCGIGAPLTAAAFSTVLGKGGTLVVTASLFLFAFSSMVGWSYYGVQCLTYLRGRKTAVFWFRIAFFVVAAAGSVCDVGQAWILVDLCNAMMAIPNLLGILILSGKGLEELRDWEQKKVFQKNKNKGLTF